LPRGTAPDTPEQPEPKPAPPRDTYSLAEFNARMGIHEATGRRWIQAGVIKAIRIRRRYRIPVSEVARLMKTAAVKP
jgi:excisionase family DNA binding protein